jgi:hypothetical protein
VRSAFPTHCLALTRGAVFCSTEIQDKLNQPDPVEDDIRLHEGGWKERYYYNKLSLDMKKESDKATLHQYAPGPHFSPTTAACPCLLASLPDCCAVCVSRADCSKLTLRVCRGLCCTITAVCPLGTGSNRTPFVLTCYPKLQADLLCVGVGAGAQVLSVPLLSDGQ